MNLTKKQKEEIKKIIGKCEHSSCENKENLEIHRIKRKGEYSIRNIKILCEMHHKMYHGKEFTN